MHLAIISRVASERHPNPHRERCSHHQGWNTRHKPSHLGQHWRRRTSHLPQLLLPQPSGCQLDGRSDNTSTHFSYNWLLKNRSRLVPTPASICADRPGQAGRRSRLLPLLPCVADQRARSATGHEAALRVLLCVCLYRAKSWLYDTGWGGRG